MSKDQRKAMLTRVAPSTYEAIRASAHALGFSISDYVAIAAAEKAARDADQVDIAHVKHSDEIKRLTAAANDLIALANPKRGK